VKFLADPKAVQACWYTDWIIHHLVQH